MSTAAVLLTLILTTTFLSASGGFAPSSPPSNFQNASLIAAILSTLGFQDLSAAAAAANISGAAPITIFAPADSSLLTCPTCSIPLLLQEHSLPGLYPLHFLRTLAFGTKTESLAAGRCLTVTASSGPTATAKVFINGVEITKPDLFNNGVHIVHGLKGFVSHLSPLSCAVETMSSLSFPQQAPPMAALFNMRLMLKDAMTRLRVGGYSVVALAMRIRYLELSDLRSMTLFAIDDESIFVDGDRGGQAYVAELGFHIVPNRLLMAADLIGLPGGTALPTMARGRSLVVTSAGDGGPLAPTRINYAKVKSFDLVHNTRIVVHGLSKPFRHVDH
ncbi:fasciclin-like arabinogalactan protein 21 [Phtheirospermum japonicum]|uniref:Fasciclin-like arabinogalactan protein 21 n=1 Tax=Phtheirospermum japonicum TaxID=374723 RepID=A0A830C8E4_9LAMI|nr:fasciclin-like arabinogalactan protein 21 [Phtheirospermum japonicum]